MSKRSDPAAFARATGAADPATFAEPAPAPAPDLVPLPQAAPESAGALAVPPAPGASPPALFEEEPDSPTPYIDANGFDPAAYEWVPVARRPRKDGWSPAKQRLFIEVLADTGCVAEAAREVHMSPRSCYALRRLPGAEPFAAAWDAAIQQASKRLIDLAFDRVIHGTDEPVFDRDGNRVGRRMRQDNRLLMFLLRAYQPERFRHAHESFRRAGEVAPPSVEPVPKAIARLEPVTPAEPHLLHAPEDLDVAVQCADIARGRLPHWHRHAEPDYDPYAGPAVRDEEFERQLEAAKREADGLPPEEDDEEDWDE